MWWVEMSLTRISFEADDAYFIDLCFSISREGMFHCLFIKDFMHLLFIYSFIERHLH